MNKFSEGLKEKILAQNAKDKSPRTKKARLEKKDHMVVFV